MEDSEEGRGAEEKTSSMLWILRLNGCEYDESVLIQGLATPK
jgi:hypothetical protein